MSTTSICTVSLHDVQSHHAQLASPCRRSAADLARVSNDSVWYGAAVEGVASARLMLALIGAGGNFAAAAAASRGGASQSFSAQGSSRCACGCVGSVWVGACGWVGVCVWW